MLDSAFQKLKTNLELKDGFDELIQQKHKAVRSVIENINPNIKTQLIGSLQRQTKIHPSPDDVFDIDILVILGSVDTWAPAGQGITKQEAMQRVRNVVGQSKRYDAMNPQIDEPTVVFEHKDGVKVELVPAFIDNIGHWSDGTPTIKGRGFWIPKNGRWELADYNHEAQHLTNLNKISDEMLVPAIKMLKALKRKHFPNLGSFHLEILSSHTVPGTVLQYKDKNIPITYPDLICNFFLLGKNLLHQPVKIYNSNSLGINLTGTELANTYKTFNDIYEYCEAIEMQPTDQAKVDAWKNLFGDAMPLS
jgi:hypothetical protein